MSVLAGMGPGAGPHELHGPTPGGLNGAAPLEPSVAGTRWSRSKKKKSCLTRRAGAPRSSLGYRGESLVRLCRRLWAAAMGANLVREK